MSPAVPLSLRAPASSLVAHPRTPLAAVRQVRVLARRDPAGVLELHYRLEGDLPCIAIPVAGEGGAADDLWRHTCFEAFLAAPDSSAYRELNFSPSLAWASYHFGGYRERLAAQPRDPPPQLAVRRERDALALHAVVRLGALAASVPLRVALSAVVEDFRGVLSYWALRHPPGKPDFHHPHGFVLEI